jgi:hypothetical protein
LKIELEHYHFSNYKEEKVTFGLKYFLTKIVPYVLRSDLFPKDVQRYFYSDDLPEKLVPDNWWTRASK